MSADDGRLKPAIGYCHECDRAVTGERRYCGPCAAKREGERPKSKTYPPLPRRCVCQHHQAYHRGPGEPKSGPNAVPECSMQDARSACPCKGYQAAS